MRKILVIEDDHSIREMLSIFLHHKGFCPFLAGSVEAGLTIWRDLMPEINIVISDYALHEKTANDILPIIKSQKPETRTILISGSAPWIITSDIMKSVDTFIPKPIDLSRQLWPALNA